MLTPLETQLLKAIINDDYQDGQNPVDNPIWAIGIATTLEEGGALASLIKKEFAVFQDNGKKFDNYIWITQAGMDAVALVAA